MRVAVNVEQLVQDGVSGIATLHRRARAPAPGPRLGRDRVHRAAPERAGSTAAMRATGPRPTRAGRAPAPAPGAVRRVAHRSGVASPMRRVAPVDLVHAPSLGGPAGGERPRSSSPRTTPRRSRCPSTYTRRGRWFHRRGFAAAAKRARLVIAVSEFCADELAAHTPIPRDRIRVVPNGVDARTRRPTEQVARVVTAVGIDDRPYVFWVGTLQPRKNVRGAASTRSRGSTADDVPHRLVLAGPPGLARRRRRTATRALGDRVRLLGPGRRRADLVRALRGRRPVRVPEPARGLRAPRARGDGAGHRGGVQRHPGAARGRRATPRASSAPTTSTAGPTRSRRCSRPTPWHAADDGRERGPTHARAASYSWRPLRRARPLAVYREALADVSG